jgi:hypothetical protein
MVLKNTLISNKRLQRYHNGQRNKLFFLVFRKYQFILQNLQQLTDFSHVYLMSSVHLFVRRPVLDHSAFSLTRKVNMVLLKAQNDNFRFAVSPCIFTHCLYWFQQLHCFNSTLVQCLSLKMRKIFKSHTPTCFDHLMTIIRESPAPS